jgi:hypothetical protein
MDLRTLHSNDIFFLNSWKLNDNLPLMPILVPKWTWKHLCQIDCQAITFAPNIINYFHVFHMNFIHPLVAPHPTILTLAPKKFKLGFATSSIIYDLGNDKTRSKCNCMCNLCINFGILHKLTINKVDY